MNVPDIVILVIVGFSSLFGLWRGFVREVLAVIAWIAAIVIARLYGPLLVPYLEGITDSETGRSILAFALLGFGTLFIGALIIRFMTRLISMAGMQVTDRVLGTIFGFARGVIIVAVVIFFAHERFDNESWWVESLTIPYVDMVIERAGFTPGITSAAV